MAKNRIDKLFELASKANSNVLSTRYVRIARDISKHFKVRLSKEQKLVFCRGCNRHLINGYNAKYRTSKGRLVITCSCGRVRRIPFNKSFQ